VQQMCQPLEKGQLRAFWVGSGVTVVARGQLPSPCWRARLEESDLTVWPPEFLLLRCAEEQICPEVVVPYTISRHMPLATSPVSVKVHHAEGSDEIPVEDDPTDYRRISLPLAAAEQGSFDEATGLSEAMSFDEAFRNALNALPKWGPASPDDMTVVQVVEVGAWFGGLAGFRHLFMRVRRPKRAPE
jgi:hypothetical protein